MNYLRATLLPVAALLLWSSARPTLPARSAALPPISANDNQVRAGRLANGVLDVRLEAREGNWSPYGADSTAIPIIAFAELGKGLQTPGPLLRVNAGTRIHASVTNSARSTLVVHGLADRRRAIMDTLVVPVGATREVTFLADEAGTFFYWGTTTGAPFDARVFDDALLNGALIVDDPRAAARRDRVFVVQFWVSKSDSADLNNAVHFLFSINGRPWPFTERLSLNQGDSVHWRVINASADIHPLHLHGFYFRVTARGDIQRDTMYRRQQERMGVTELMDEGTTQDISWLADRPGGWVFHCHLNYHVLPNPLLGALLQPTDTVIKKLFSAPDMARMHDETGNHAEKGMGGLVLAINIKPKAGWTPYTGPRERLRLYVQTDSQPSDTARRFGYVLAHGNEAPSGSVQWPGPAIILHKGRPTSIWVINHIAEPTQVHWHGLELDSYYDGVAGVSSNAGLVSPMIMPSDSFEVTVTPPRSGSFMYHTHINDLRQQSHGLYGPLIVLDSGQTWNPETDLTFQVATDPADGQILNGGKAPAALTLRVGTSYRMRLMNVSLDVPLNQMWLVKSNGAFPQWTALAKDGYDLPEQQRVPSQARQLVSIGNTYDFRITFPAPGEYEMQARRGSGRIDARQVIHVVK